MNPSAAPATRPVPSPTTVALVTLGCARNEVDSEELAGRLEAGGFLLVEDPQPSGRAVVEVEHERDIERPQAVEIRRIETAG